MWKLRDASHLSLGAKLYQEFDLFHPGGEPGAIGQLPGVSAINMFVGANHSGKSRFLRALARDLELSAAPDSEHSQWRAICMVRESFLRALQDLKGRPPSVISSHFRNLGSEFFQVLRLDLKSSENGIPCSSSQLGRIDHARALLQSLEEAFEAQDFGASVRDISDHSRLSRLRDAIGPLKQYLPQQRFGAAPNAIYIPILRSLRLFDAAQQTVDKPVDLYGQLTQRDYLRDAGHVVVFTGYALFHHIRDMLLGRQDERRRVREYEQFLSERFFEGKEITLTPHRDGVLHVTIDGEERAIHDVGDGLQSAIILTFEPFVRRDEPCLFFIEEPELFLHPSLQRHILEFFLGCENHLFFFTTHSNHFPGMSFDYDDISIYNFQRNVSASKRDKPRFLVTPVSRGDHSSLELLGVRNSSVFLANATIWVEGITDRRYIRKFLELYRRHCAEHGATPDEDISRLEEDIHYAFVEYGGANLPRWSFSPMSGAELSDEQANKRPIEVRTLCGKAIVIRDDDETSTDTSKTAKRTQNELLKGALGERILLTPGREIENLLPSRVIEAVMKQSVPAAQVASLTRQAYRDERLGQFLDEEAGKPGKWGGRYGTLKQKNEFCSKAVEHLDKLTFAELDDEVQNMVKQICRFLVEQNRFVLAPRRS